MQVLTNSAHDNLHFNFTSAKKFFYIFYNTGWGIRAYRICSNKGTQCDDLILKGFIRKHSHLHGDRNHLNHCTRIKSFISNKDTVESDIEFYDHLSVLTSTTFYINMNM